MSRLTELLAAAAATAAGYVAAQVLAEWLGLQALSEDMGEWLRTHVPFPVYVEQDREITVSL